MKIERFRLDAFGRLYDVSTDSAALPGLVVLLGPNEAGKSTVFHFLTSMLYGFYPASRESHPYAPWDGSDPSGSVTLRLDAGGCAEVERRLRSQPSGRLTVGGREDELRNRTLPWAEHVPRAVFRQVYALTLAELAGLDGETWGRVQDRLVGSMGATDIRSARQVVAELEKEAGELWRPTRRGNQRIRDLRASIRKLRDRRREAAERDRRLREVVAEAETVRARLHDVREEREHAKVAVERVQELVPIRSQLRRIDALRREAGPPASLTDLPPDPPKELDRLRDLVRTLDERRESIREERADPAVHVAEFGDAERALLERADEITRFLGRAAALAGDRARLSALEQEARDLKRRTDAVAVPLFERADDVPTEALAALPVAELRIRLRRLSTARDEQRVLETAAEMERAPGLEAPSPTPSPVVAAGALAVGLALLALGVWKGFPWAIAVGAAAAGAGVVLLVLRARPIGRTDPDAAHREAEERVARARAAHERARREVAELLDGLPLRQDVVDAPDDALAAGLERLQELLGDRDERRQGAERLAARIAEVDGEAARLAGTLGLDTTLDAEALSHLLDRSARRAERLREAALAAERELGRLDREDARHAEELRRVSASLETLTRRLEAEGEGDALRGAHRVRERSQAAERADQLLDEMERAHPDLDELRKRIRDAEASGDAWTVDDDDLAHRKARVEELTEQVEALATRAEGLDHDAASLRRTETVDAVDGEIASLQEEEQALLIERDRRWVLARLLRQADRRFREEHQPDLMRRAGVYLGKLTGGRYDRIVADESEGSGRFQILGPGVAAPVPLASPVSTGTLEQAYLALRLAIVDHLDRGLERLPLFVDEVFVNWDDVRRPRGMDLLADISRQRQVFAFTCHPEIAAELETRGGLVLRIGDGG